MAYQFNGSSQYLNCGSAVATAPPITMSCWVNLSSLTFPNGGGGCPLVLDDSATYQSYRLQIIQATGVVRAITINADASASAFSVTTTGLTVGAWAHCAARFNSSASRFAFVNGVAAAESSTSLAIPAPTRTIIGATSSTAGQLNQNANGSIAEAAIWNAALTNAEIASLAAGFTPDQIRPQSLQFYAPLVRNLQDFRGGRAITNNNGATVATHPRIIT